MNSKDWEKLEYLNRVINSLHGSIDVIANDWTVEKYITSIPSYWGVKHSSGGRIRFKERVWVEIVSEIEDYHIVVRYDSRRSRKSTEMAWLNPVPIRELKVVCMDALQLIPFDENKMEPIHECDGTDCMAIRIHKI